MQKDKTATSELRQRAEDKVRQKERSAHLSEVDARALCHELEVHQIELELQNEELLLAQARLEASEEKYRDLYEFAPIGYFTLGSLGEILEANLTGASLLGKDRMYLVRSRFQQYLYPGCLREFNAFCRRIIELDAKQSAEFKLGETGGKEKANRWVQIEARAIRDSTSHCISMAAIDITERKRMEKELSRKTAGLLRFNQDLDRKVVERTSELKKRYEEIEQLTYAIASDLMVPLVTIKGLIGFLEKDVATGNRRRIEMSLGLVEDAAERMAILLSRTLELSNIGRLSNPTELVPFVEVVQEALSHAEEMLKSSQAEITISENFPVVNIDRARIVDVLVNLINNCIQYAGDENPPCIEIGHYRDGVETVFFVKDKGVGIDPSMQKSIFMLFHKDKDSGSHDVGLGLSKRIIEAHGGHMWIESEPKKGCIVYFKIPSISK